MSRSESEHAPAHRREGFRISDHLNAIFSCRVGNVVTIGLVCFSIVHVQTGELLHFKGCQADSYVCLQCRWRDVMMSEWRGAEGDLTFGGSGTKEGGGLGSLFSISLLPDLRIRARGSG